MRPFRFLTCCPGMRPVVCLVWAVVWLFSTAAPTLGWTGTDVEDGRLAHASFSAIEDGGLLTADPTTSGTGDKEEDEREAGKDGCDEASAADSDRALTDVGSKGQKRCPGVPVRLEGRMWLLHCALKLDC